MNGPVWGAVVALLAYLAGSIPFGLLVARYCGGIDIRRVGSGNIGATNVGRAIGKKWGLLVLGLDALKGLLPVWLLPLIPAWATGQPNPHLAVLAGVCTILGHMFPCWLGFRGGKGVATSLGVVLVLAPLGTLAAFVVFAATFAASRIVSLSSILASIAFALWQMVRLSPHPFSADHWSLAAFSLLVPTLIIIRHRSNVLRLLRGEEPQFHAPVAAGAGEQGADKQPSGAGNGATS